ncbi:MAG: hypothetical protein JXA96_01120 [Sedimentisphaerales bacterium]|nr:hypothetical protein [Sedimentisphaerales bacterium]
MLRKSVFTIIISLCFFFSSLADGKVIEWVNEYLDTDSNVIRDDQGWIDWLTSEGYQVNVRTLSSDSNGYWYNGTDNVALSEDILGYLNSADLVVISRSADSNDFSNGGNEATSWNNDVTTPILSTLVTQLSSDNWGWLKIVNDEANLYYPQNPKLEAVLPEHPMFFNVSLGPDNQVSIINPAVGWLPDDSNAGGIPGTQTFFKTTSAGNGNIIAKIGDGTDYIWIAEWPKSETIQYYPGGTYSPVGSNRMVFSAGLKENSSDLSETTGTARGALNLNNAGKTLFVNAVRYMTDSLDCAAHPEPAYKSMITAAPASSLSWMPGMDADKHDVYFGTDFNDVNSADRNNPLDVLVNQAQDANNFSLDGLLDLNKTYYWRIDEVNTMLNPSIIKGDVWSFSTYDYLIIDDFESYKNNSPEKVNQTWIDGQGFLADEFFPQGHSGNGTGSAVGYDPNAGNIIETTIFNSGKQSMPIFYDNTGTTNISEAIKYFEITQDWSVFDVKTLVLHFRGTPGNTGQLYVKFNANKVTYTADSSAIARDFWTQWNIDLAPIAAKRGGLSIKNFTIGIEGETSGVFYVDDIRLYRNAPLATNEIIKLDNEFGDHQVVQRTIGSTDGTVNISGTFDNSDVNRIEAQVIDFTTGNPVVVWQEIPIDSSNSQFSDTISVPQGYWYRLVVRALNSNNAEVARTSGTNPWGVGINILCIGQSNMCGNGAIFTYHNLNSDMAGLYSNDKVWKKFAEPYDGGGLKTDIDYDSWIGVSMIPYLLNSLAQNFPGIPIGIIPAARGSSPLHGTENLCWLNRDEANHFNSSNLYGNSLSKTRTVGGIELIIMHQGETDAQNVVSTEQYIADFKTFIAHYREDLYPSVPLFFCQLARSFTSIAEKNRTDENMQAIRAAQLLSDDPNNSLYLAALCIDVSVRPNDDHYYQDAYDTIGLRIGNAIAYYFDKSNYYRGPEIASAALSEDRTYIDVSISHRGGNDLTPETGITGFDVLNSSEAKLPISSVVKIDSAKLRINLSSAASSEPISIRYLYGKSPNITGAVHDNSPLKLPLEPTAIPIVVSE